LRGVFVVWGFPNFFFFNSSSWQREIIAPASCFFFDSSQGNAYALTQFLQSPRTIFVVYHWQFVRMTKAIRLTSITALLSMKLLKHISIFLLFCPTARIELELTLN